MTIKKRKMKIDLVKIYVVSFLFRLDDILESTWAHEGLFLSQKIYIS